MNIVHIKIFFIPVGGNIFSKYKHNLVITLTNNESEMIIKYSC